MIKHKCSKNSFTHKSKIIIQLKKTKASLLQIYQKTKIPKKNEIKQKNSQTKTQKSSSSLAIISQIANFLKTHFFYLESPRISGIPSEFPIITTLLFGDFESSMVAWIPFSRRMFFVKLALRISLAFALP